MSQSNEIVYSAAQGREFLRGELEDKPNEWVREFAGMVDDPRTLDVLNHYCSLWHEMEDNDLPRHFLDSRMGQLIIRNASTVAVDRAYRDGNASMLQGMVGLTSSEGDAQDAVGTCAKRLTREGAIGLVLGPPGAGKTATTLDTARAWGARTGGRIIGNTSWEGFDAVVTSDHDLLEDMATHEGPVLAVIDETAQELSGYGTESNKAEAFANATFELDVLDPSTEDPGASGFDLAALDGAIEGASLFEHILDTATNRGVATRELVIGGSGRQFGAGGGPEDCSEESGDEKTQRGSVEDHTVPVLVLAERVLGRVDRVATVGDREDGCRDPAAGAGFSGHGAVVVALGIGCIVLGSYQQLDRDAIGSGLGEVVVIAIQQRGCQ